VTIESFFSFATSSESLILAMCGFDKPVFATHNTTHVHEHRIGSSTCIVCPLQVCPDTQYMHTLPIAASVLTTFVQPMQCSWNSLQLFFKSCCRLCPLLALALVQHFLFPHPLLDICLLILHTPSTHQKTLNRVLEPHQNPCIQSVAMTSNTGWCSQRGVGTTTSQHSIKARLRG
jgi:hypothetical protein